MPSATGGSYLAPRKDDGDTLDSLLSLEEQYYNEGYQLGETDGSRAGRIEGYLFGLQKGFEKYAEMGALNARCAIWEARAISGQGQGPKQSVTRSATADIRIEPTSRLIKQIETLADLTEVDFAEIVNDEEQISIFEDELKRAKGKAKIIASMVGDDKDTNDVDNDNDIAARTNSNADNFEDFTLPRSLKTGK